MMRNISKNSLIVLLEIMALTFGARGGNAVTLDLSGVGWGKSHITVLIRPAGVR